MLYDAYLVVPQFPASPDRSPTGTSIVGTLNLSDWLALTTGASGVDHPPIRWPALRHCLVSESGDRVPQIFENQGIRL
jgi:hypothetical protein